jgi:hypothetical protein
VQFNTTAHGENNGMMIFDYKLIANLTIYIEKPKPYIRGKPQLISLTWKLDQSISMKCYLNYTTA